MPSHSDNEYPINPDSKICTYSLGATRNIVFTEIHGTDIETLEVESNSLYVMSRESQAWFKHGIHDSLCSEGRYSITIRQVNLDNTRGLLIMGDSNTKPIQFGDGKGKVGRRYPGKRLKANTIADIDPYQCSQHRNIALMCGTNDLRPGPTRPNISQLARTLMKKVLQIKQVNPLCNVFVIPVMPTRDIDMNKYVIEFNNLVNNLIKQNHDSSITFPPLYSFLDNRRLLALPLTRDGDSIHLGSRGIAQFVSLLKQLIYSSLERPVRQQKTKETRDAGSSKPA